MSSKYPPTRPGSGRLADPGIKLNREALSPEQSEMIDKVEAMLPNPERLSQFDKIHKEIYQALLEIHNLLPPPNVLPSHAQAYRQRMADRESAAAAILVCYHEHSNGDRNSAGYEMIEAMLESALGLDGPSGGKGGRDADTFRHAVYRMKTNDRGFSR